MNVYLVLPRMSNERSSSRRQDPQATKAEDRKRGGVEPLLLCSVLQNCEGVLLYTASCAGTSTNSWCWEKTGEAKQVARTLSEKACKALRSDATS